MVIKNSCSLGKSKELFFISKHINPKSPKPLYLSKIKRAENLLKRVALAFSLLMISCCF
jgi:hypothetical protein